MKLRFLFCLLALTGPLAADTPESLESLLSNGRKAWQAENYQGAVDFYTRAQKLYPESDEAFQSLADLYSSQKLYSLAAEELQVLRNRHPDDRDTLYNLAETYGYLNKNEEAIKLFEQGLLFFPGDRAFILALSWMYGKVEKFQKGITLLEAALATAGTDRSFEMYLGTLYSDVYDYEKSRAHYLKAIVDSAGDNSYQALCYYNLSLVESSFYRFDRAFKAAEQCLALEDRSGGHIILGELYQNRLDFRKSQEELETADKTDDTPYSKFDLVQLYLQFGYLDQAQAYLKKIEEKKDDSWMYNYGITKKKFDRDLNESWYKLYKAQAAVLDFEPKPWVWDWVFWFFKKISLLIQAWFHEMTYRQLTQELAQESVQAGSDFDAWPNLYKAYEPYPTAALKYLSLSRDFELSKTKLAQPSWDMETGKLSKNPTLLLKAIQGFQRPDENYQINEALGQLIPLLRDQGKAEEADRLTAQLYKLNPGALLQKGLSLPLQLNVYGGAPEHRAEVENQVLEFGGWCGYRISSSGRPGVEYTLNIQLGSDKTWRYSLRDANGTAVFSDFTEVLPESRTEFLKELFLRIHRLP